MPGHYTYLLIDLLCILVPFLSSFHPAIQFHKHWGPFFISCMLTGLFFIIWDIYFTRIGVWLFNSRYVTGLHLYNLPIEEVLFFICVPYASVFTYFCLKRFYDVSRYVSASYIISLVLIISLGVIAFLHPGKLYTSVTFALLSLFLIVLLVKRVKFLPGFYLAFIVILFPFFISNGILTGSHLEEPVVRYDDAYNLGIRMYTIPVEDTFYGMLLLLMNVTGFEYLERKRKTNSMR